MRVTKLEKAICYCPSCKDDLVSQENAFLGRDFDDLVVYKCKCGQVSRWLFETPIPLLVEYE
jgi:hypothetical protein